jgi:hypothetical protein
MNGLIIRNELYAKHMAQNETYVAAGSPHYGPAQPTLLQLNV